MEMIILLAVFFTSIILLYSLKFCKKQFHSIELLLLFMFSSSICQITYYKLFSPYDRLGEVQALMPDLTVKIHYGLILPTLLIWAMYIYCSEQTNLKKITTLFLWILFVIMAEKFYLVVGILQSKSKSWYPSIDMVFGMVIVLLTIFFTERIKNVLRKEKII